MTTATTTTPPTATFKRWCRAIKFVSLKSPDGLFDGDFHDDERGRRTFRPAYYAGGHREMDVRRP